MQFCKMKPKGFGQRKIIIANMGDLSTKANLLERLLKKIKINEIPFEMLQVSNKIQLFETFKKHTVAITLLCISSSRLGQVLDFVSAIRNKIKEQDTRIIVLFDGLHQSSINEIVFNNEINGILNIRELSEDDLKIELRLAFRSYARIEEIKNDYERTRIMKKLSNIDSSFKGISHFISSIYKQLRSDPNIKNVAVFENKKILLCSGNKLMFLNLYTKWEMANEEVIGDFLFLRIREIENYVIAVESLSSTKKPGRQYSMDLIEQAAAVRKNLINLVKNDKLLLDLYFISANSNKLMWVEAAKKNVSLYFGNKDAEIINQPLKVVHQFFGEDNLLQISRSILVNKRKIKSINRLSSRNISIEMNNGKHFAVSRGNIKKVEALLNRQKKLSKKRFDRALV